MSKSVDAITNTASTSFTLDFSGLLAILAFIISIINVIYTIKRTNFLEKAHNENFEYTKNKDKDDFILNFKDDFQDLRQSITDLIQDPVNLDKLNPSHKENILYVIESKYDKNIILKYFNKNIYDDFIELKIFIDETVQMIIYQKDLTNVFHMTQRIKYFLDKVKTEYN